MCVYMCTYMSICVCMCSGVEAAVSSSSTAGTIWAQARSRVGLLESLFLFFLVCGAGTTPVAGITHRPDLQTCHIQQL